MSQNERARKPLFGGFAPPHLRGWFGKTRRHRWLRLFLFEFLVVLLGVLAATALQQHFEQQADERRAEDAIATLKNELATLGYGAELRQRNYVCTIYRTGLMEQRIRGEDTIVDHQSFHPPDDALVTFPGWGSDMIGSMRRYLDEDELNSISVISELAERLERLQESEREGWTNLHRISDDLGEPTEADLSAAKEGLVAAKLALGSIFQTSQEIVRLVEALGAEIDLEKFDEFADAGSVCRQLLPFTFTEQWAEVGNSGRLLTGQPIEAFKALHSEENAAQ